MINIQEQIVQEDSLKGQDISQKVSTQNISDNNSVASAKEQKRHLSTLNVLFKTIIASIGFFFYGYQQAILNLSLKTLNVIFDIKESEKTLYEGLLSCLSPVGAIIGCIATSYMAKNISRSKTFYITDIVSIIGSIISVVSNNIYVFMVGRLVSGFSVGVNTAFIPQYVNEISPSSLKGVTGSILSVFICIGLIVSNIQSLGYEDEPQNVGNADDLGNFWRFAFMFPGAMTLIRSIVFLFIIRQDTAQYHMMMGQKDIAEKILKLNYKSEFIQNELEIIEHDIQNQKQGLKYWKDLLSPQYIKRFKLGIFLQFLQQFSGINAIVFYSSKIFQEIVDDNKIVFALALLCNVIMFFCAFITAYLSTKYGRRSVLINGDIGCFSFLCIFGLISLLKNYGAASSDVTNPIVIICIFGYMFFFGISLGPVVWAYNSEILPEKGLSLATITNWLSTIIIIFFFPMALSAIPIGYIFFFFSFWCLIGIIYMKLNVIETKDRTQKQIEEAFNQNINSAKVQDNQ